MFLEVADLIEKTNSLITSLSPDIWVKHNSRDPLTFYSPKRVFVYLTVQKKGLDLTVFTRGKEIDGVEPFEYESGGAKWGRFKVKSGDDLARAKAIFAASLAHIQEAIGANENTCWYAPLEAENELSEEDFEEKNPLQTNSESAL